MRLRLVATVSFLIAAAVLAAGGVPVLAKTLRFANDGDIVSLDPYARNEAFQLSFVGNIYEPLIRRDRHLAIEPALALAWTAVAPELWRFKLRQGVRFHDGSPFTADDVVFSFARVQMDGSALRAAVATVKSVVKIDDYTLEMTTDGPDPILPEELTRWSMMSKAWAEGNDAVRPADVARGEELYASLHANGTGPFKLAEREADARTRLVANDDWWDKPEHNLKEVVFTPMASEEARIAALLAGEIDVMQAVPMMAIDKLRKSHGIRIVRGPELRTVFLGFDQVRDELIDSDVKGRNPFKDVRVRRAFTLAIDEEAIRANVMHGLATPAGLLVAPGVNGFDAALNGRYPYEPETARKLLAEAGYPKGFSVGMDCPTDRYLNDAEICRAVVGMLGRVGITVKLLAQTRSMYFAKVLAPRYNTSFFMLGWWPTSYDARDTLVNVVATRTAEGQGLFNVGGYSNTRVDALLAQAQTEGDPARRQAELGEAMRIHKEEFGHIPLHQQPIVWAARDNIELVQGADGSFPLRFVRVN